MAIGVRLPAYGWQPALVWGMSRESSINPFQAIIMDESEQNPRSRYTNLPNELPEYQTIPDYLESTFNMLLCAFPNEVTDEQYWALLTILNETMSQRTLAHVVSILTQKHWFLVFNDVAGVGVDPPPAPDVIKRVENRLRACGYDEWPKHVE
ncbi:MAG: hypothetical protein KJ065_13750 [Anaerolineae bacterium]|nr:hypothetical protein [Anaerolineae bacterium]